MKQRGGTGSRMPGHPDDLALVHRQADAVHPRPGHVVQGEHDRGPIPAGGDGGSPSSRCSPSMSRTSSRLVIPLVGTVAIRRPPRSTVTRSATLQDLVEVVRDQDDARPVGAQLVEDV